MSVFAMGSRLQGLRTVLEAFMFMLFVQGGNPKCDRSCHQITAHMAIPA